MKKFMNTADDFLKESLQGFGVAHQDIVSVTTNLILLHDPNLLKKAKLP